VDVTKHLRRWLTNDVLATFDDVYEGTIVAVTEQRVRNRFTGKHADELVVTFADRWQWIPNLTARRSLVGWFGVESDDWLGRRVQVIRKSIERIDRATGEVKVRHERIVACPDPHARLPVRDPEVLGRDYVEFAEAVERLAADEARGGHE
jgi:hypothetical protein